MRFLLGLLFGLLLGGVLAMLLAAQQAAAETDDRLLFGAEDQSATQAGAV